MSGIDLDVGPGRIFWVVGENGAGKTSLLRALAGLDPPRRGRVERLAPIEAPFLYFHPGMGIPASSTVADWERLLLRLLPPEGSRARTPLWPVVDPVQRVGRLSTGERKRLLLDGLLRRRGSLLLDEPYEHLSPTARTRLTGVLEARARLAVVLVATHQWPADPGYGLRLQDGGAVPLTSREGP